MNDLEWISIADDYPLRPGAEVRIRCLWQSNNLYIRAAQWALIESKLQKSHPEFEVVSYNNGDEFLTVEIKVVEPPDVTPQVQRAGLITVGQIAILLGIVVIGIFGAIAFKDHYAELKINAQTKYAETMTAKLEAVKWPIIVVAAAAAFIFGVLRFK